MLVLDRGECRKRAFLACEPQNEIKVASWQIDLCTNQFGRKKLADG